jgi:hypothetical protein
MPTPFMLKRFSCSLLATVCTASIGHIDFIYLSDEDHAAEVRARQARGTQQ